MSAAGFSNVSHERLSLEKELHSAERFARGLVYGNPLFQEIQERGGDAEEVTSAIAQGLEAAYGRQRKMRLSCIVFDAQRD